MRLDAGGRAFAGTALYSNCPNTPGSICDLSFRVSGNVLAGAVPEPTTWAMLILGIGITGSSLRASRKRRVALTFA